MVFEDFGLDPRCLHVLREWDIHTPTPVQAQAIPIALEGHDLIAVAQTGTGKTLGYTLPCLTRLAQGKVHSNMMLVLVPTRELAQQTHEVINDMGKALGIRASLIYGGVGYDKQNRDLKKGCAVVVATPGRLLDHLERGNAHFGELVILVLDEADRMLDMGFLPDIKRILCKLPNDRQTLMFSATFPDEISRLAREMLHEPERVTVGATHKPVDKVRQVLYTVQVENKSDLLLQLLEGSTVNSTMIFLRTKERTERLAHLLKRHKLKAVAIHGDRSQSQREEALRGFRSGKYSILVATDVAARGLDIDGVSHVFNYDIPPTAEDYLHRIGRTARADTDGDAITFVTPQEYKELESIERTLGKSLPRGEWDGSVNVLSLFVPKEQEKKSRPAANRRGRRGLLRRR
ncbi:MAG: DEAD/DEAH box family ATP-dependent RNA helicase [Candidatus Hydrogenedentota bacterium]